MPRSAPRALFLRGKAPRRWPRKRNFFRNAVLGKNNFRFFASADAKLCPGLCLRPGPQMEDGKNQFFDFFRPSLAIFRRVWYTTKKIYGKPPPAGRGTLI